MSESRKIFRAGDCVLHGPTGEKWALACDEVDGKVYWMGWPFGGYGLAEDCTLHRAATDEQRCATLLEISQKTGNEPPIYYAREQLEAESSKKGAGDE